MATQICTPLNKKEKRLCMVELPDDIIFSSILPHLSLKEVAQTSLVSRNWLHYWRHIPVLTFQNPIGIQRMMSSQAFQSFESYSDVLANERRDFIIWVDGILSKHMADVILEFNVSFYFQDMYRKTIDRWLVWAFSKHVQRLQLHFPRPRVSYAILNQHYVLDKPLLLHPCLKVKPVLTSLSLHSVNVTDAFLDLLFQSCGNILEFLSIHKSENLTTIKADSKSNVVFSELRYLKVSYCDSMKTIDIHSPKLVTFVYESGSRPGLELLRIANASSLSHVTIQTRCEDRFLFLLRSVAKYFSQLEYVKLNWWLNSKSNTNPVVDYFPVLPKLKHLHMCVFGYIKRNIVGWIPFIQACPVLEKLTMQLYHWIQWRSKKVKREKHPLLNLKTFEIIDFDGENVDVGVANFVFENGVALEEMILQSRAIHKDKTLSSLRLKIPKTLKLIRIT